MCSVSGDDNCVNAEEEVGGWDPLPDIIWYVRPSANSRRLKKKWEGRIGADEWKDSKGVLLHSCRHLTKRSEVWHSKNACRHDNWALPSSTPHFFPLFFCLKWSVSSICLLCVCRFYRRVRSCTQSLLTGREFTTFFFSPFTWKDFLFILVVPCKVQYDTGINSLICPPPFLRVALHDRAASICTHTHTHTLAVSLCKYGIFKLDSTNKGMTASYYILYVCVCVCTRYLNRDELRWEKPFALQRVSAAPTAEFIWFLTDFLLLQFFFFFSFFSQIGFIGELKFR